MNYREFSQKIKTKYPDYADMDDRDLAKRMVAKFPDYSDVSFDEPSPVTPEPTPKIGVDLPQNLGYETLTPPAPVVQRPQEVSKPSQTLNAGPGLRIKPEARAVDLGQTIPIEEPAEVKPAEFNTRKAFVQGAKQGLGGIVQSVATDIAGDVHGAEGPRNEFETEMYNIGKRLTETKVKPSDNRERQALTTYRNIETAKKLRGFGREKVEPALNTIAENLRKGDPDAQMSVEDAQYYFSTKDALNPLNAAKTFHAASALAANSAAQTAASMVPGIGTAALIGSEQGNWIDQAKNSGLDNQDILRDYSIAYGLLSGGIEQIGGEIATAPIRAALGGSKKATDKVLQIIGKSFGKKAVETATKQSVKKIVSKTVGDYLGSTIIGAIGEGVEEYGQDYLSDALLWAAFDQAAERTPDKAQEYLAKRDAIDLNPALKKRLEAAKLGAVAGGFMRGVTTTGAKAVETVKGKPEAQKPVEQITTQKGSKTLADFRVPTAEAYYKLPEAQRNQIFTELSPEEQDRVMAAYPDELLEEAKNAKGTGTEAGTTGRQEGPGGEAPGSVYLRDDARKGMATGAREEVARMSDEEIRRLLIGAKIPEAQISKLSPDEQAEIADREIFRQKQAAKARPQEPSPYQQEQPTDESRATGERVAKKYGLGFKSAEPGDRDRGGVQLVFTDPVTKTDITVPAENAETEAAKLADKNRQENPVEYGKHIAATAGVEFIGRKERITASKGAGGKYDTEMRAEFRTPGGRTFTVPFSTSVDEIRTRAEEMDKQGAQNVPEVRQGKEEVTREPVTTPARPTQDSDRMLRAYIKTGKAETTPGRSAHEGLIRVLDQVTPEDIAEVSGITPAEARQAIGDIREQRKSEVSEKVRQTMAPSLFYGESVDEAVKSIQQPRAKGGEVMFSREQGDDLSRLSEDEYASESVYNKVKAFGLDEKVRSDSDFAELKNIADKEYHRATGKNYGEQGEEHSYLQYTSDNKDRNIRIRTLQKNIAKRTGIKLLQNSVYKAMDIDIPQSVFKKKTEPAQQEAFGGETPVSEIERKAEQRQQKAAVTERQEARKGGEAPLAGLPMFEDQDIEGSQMTLKLQREERPMDLDTAKEIATSNGIQYVTSTPAEGGPQYTFRDPRTGTEFTAKTRGEVRQGMVSLADRVAPRGTTKAGEGVRFQREDNKETVTLYRGDSKEIGEFDITEADPRALFGQAMYLTDSKRIAGDYKNKGAKYDEGVLYRFSSRTGTKKDAYDSWIRQRALYVDENGKEIESFTGKQLPVFDDDPIRNQRIKHAEKIAAKEFPNIDIRKQADNIFVIRSGKAPKTGTQLEVSKKILDNTIDAEAEISIDVANALYDSLRAVKDDSTAKDMLDFAKTEDENGFRPTYRDVYTSITSGSSLISSEGQAVLREKLQSLGYNGIRYSGGLTMGGAKHTAYALWNTEVAKDSTRFQREGEKRTPEQESQLNRLREQRETRYKMEALPEEVALWEANNKLIDFFRNNGYTIQETPQGAQYVKDSPEDADRYWTQFDRDTATGFEEDAGTEAFGKSRQVERGEVRLQREEQTPEQQENWERASRYTKDFSRKPRALSARARKELEDAGYKLPKEMGLPSFTFIPGKGLSIAERKTGDTEAGVRPRIKLQREDEVIYDSGTETDRAHGQSIADQLGNVKFNGVWKGFRSKDGTLYSAPQLTFTVIDNKGKGGTTILAPLDTTAGHVAKRRLDALKGEVKYQIEEPRQTVDTFFSPVLRAVQSLKQERGTGEQMFAMITKTPGVKEAEWKWMGLDDFLKGKQSVTKKEIEEFVAQNQVRVEEVRKGGRERITKEEAEKIVRNGKMVLDEEGTLISTPGQFGQYSAKAIFLKNPSQTKFSQYSLPGGPLSRDTEILTENGWQRIDAVDVGDMVLSRSDDGKLEWTPVLGKPSIHADKLYHFNNKTVDMMVTPCHQMVVRKRSGDQFHRKKTVVRMTAEKLWMAHDCNIPLCGEWMGDNEPLLFGYKATDAAEFIGWYIAEGSYKVQHGVKNTIQISQSKDVNQAKCDRLESLFNRMGLKWKYYSSGPTYGIGIRTMNPELKNILHDQPKSDGKYIPKFFFKKSKVIINALMTGLVLGDGCTVSPRNGRKEHTVYCTKSKQLADDFQVLSLLSGCRSIVTQRPNGLYVLSLCSKAWATVDDAKHGIVDYNDTAYCVTVKNHSIYVRRNGKAAFTGNSNYREVLLTLPPKPEFEMKWIKTEGGWSWFIGNEQVGPILKNEKDSQKALGALSNNERDKGIYKKFTSSHWDEPNVIAHVRLDDRTGPNGEKVLFVEEAQSDWQREARDKGVQDGNILPPGWKIGENIPADRDARPYALYDENGNRLLTGITEEEILERRNRTLERGYSSPSHDSRVPAQPFLKNWEELVMKRVLRMAAEEGYDRVAWINGEQTAARYDLSKQVDGIEVNKIETPEDKKGWHYRAFKEDESGFQGGGVIQGVAKDENELAAAIGKDAAKKSIENITSQIENNTFNGDPYRFELRGKDLKIGGEWATNLYDRMIPKFLEKYGKKWGTKVEPINIKLDNAPEDVVKRWEATDPNHPFVKKNRSPQQSIAITPEMRESVLYEGQPMFQKEGQREPQDIRREPTQELPRTRRRNLPTEEAQTSDARTPIMRAFRDFQRAVGTAFGTRLPEDGITIGDTPQTEAHQVADRLVSEEFGGTPIWFTLSPEARDLGVNFGGAQLTNHPDVVLMNTETKAPVIITAVHETMHRMQQQRPDLYWEVRDAMVEESTPELETFRQRMLNKGYSEREVMDEMVAEISGQRFVDQGFLKRLSDRSPEAFREFVETLRRVIEDIRAWIKSANITHAGKYFRDLDRVDTVLADAMVEFRRSEQGRRQPQRMAAQRETRFKRDQTKTEAFRNWFNGSKVVDENGEPLVVYHGTRTSDDFTAFKPGGLSWFAEDSEYANAYAGSLMEGSRAYPVYLKINNPADLGFRDSNTEVKAKDVKDRVVDRVLESQASGRISKEKAKSIIDGIGNEFNGPEYSEVWQWVQGERKFTDALKEAGYDGLVTREGLSAQYKAYAVLSPTQIKSATGNRGTFDPENPDIRFSRETEEPAVMEKLEGLRGVTGVEVEPRSMLTTTKDVPRETTVQYLTRRIIDKFERLRVIQNHLGKPESDATNAYLKQELMHGRIETQMSEVERDYLEPIQKLMAEAGITVDELDEYLYAKHAKKRNKISEERNKRFGKEEVHKQTAGSGMTYFEADAILKKYRENKIIQKIADQVYKFIDKKLQIMIDGDLITQEQADEWKERFGEFYVPLKGVSPDLTPAQVRRLSDLNEKRATGEPFTTEETEEYEYLDEISSQRPTERPRIGRGFSIGGKEVQAAYGRRSRAQHVLANVINDVNSAIIRSEKNRVAKAFLEYVRTHKDQKLWEIEPIEEKPRFNADGEVVYRDQPVRAYRDKATGETVQPMIVKEKGKATSLLIKDPILSNAMQNIGSEKMGKVLQAMSSFSKYFSIINTQVSPEFVVTNLTRDIQTALVNVTGVTDKAKVKGAAAEVLKNIPKAIKGAWGGLHGKADTEWQKLFKEYEKVGGKIGWFGLDTVEDIQKRLVRKLWESGVTPKAKATMLWNRSVDMVKTLNGAVENATRLSVYKAMKDRGFTAEQAASVAKNITVNFNKHGELGPMFNALYAFSNAGIQGSARLVQALKSRKVQKIAIGAAVASFALAQLNRALSGDDDDDEANYDKVPTWEKQNNMVIMLGPGRDRIKIPLPYGYNVFWALGQAFDQAVHGEPERSAAILGGAIANSFNPLGNAGSAVQNVFPTPVRWIADLGVNKDFTGKPILKEEKYGPQKSQAYLAQKNATEVSKNIAKTISFMTLGKEYEPGLLEKVPNVGKFLVSPDAYDYIFEYFTGGIGRFGTNVLRTAQSVAEGEPKLQYAPFARRFYGTTAEYADVKKFYDNMERLERVGAQYKLYLENGEDEKARNYEKAHKKEVELSGMVGGVKRSLSQMNKDKYQYEKDGNKKEADRIQKEIITLVKDINKQINEK